MPVEIPKGAQDVVENLAKEGFDRLAQTSIGKKIGDFFHSDPVAHVRNMKSGMTQTPAGKSLYKIIKEDFEPAYDKAKQQLTQQGGMTSHDINAKARNIARVTAFGRNDALAVQHIKWAEMTHELPAAQSLADHLHVYLQDTVTLPKRNVLEIKGKTVLSKPLLPGTPGAATEDVSRFKENVIMNKENQVPLNRKPIFVPRGDAEKFFTQKSVTMMAPAIAVSHLSTPFNVILGAPLRGLAKGLADVITPGGYKATSQGLLHSGVLGSMALQIYREHEMFENGLISKWTGSPTLGYIFNKAIHAPGFNSLRKWTISFAGATAKYSAEHFAQRLIDNPADRLAQYSLREMGIDPVAVLKQKGQLSNDQVEKAIYRFVDDRVFLNTKLDRSYAGQSNPIMRMATLFHSYVAAEGHLINRELVKMWRTGDIGNIVQTLTTLGLIFPTAGSVIYGLERLARGQTYNDPQLNAESGIHRYFDNISHMAGFGIVQSYMSGALRGHLDTTVLGPIGNVAVESIGDSILALTGKKSFKQPLRDIMYYTLPDNLGKILAHQLLPTQAEERAKHPHMKKLKTGLKALKH